MVVMRAFPVSRAGGDTSSDVLASVRASAMRCFARHGTEATSLRMVADSAGVSVGLIQRQFGTKAALIEAVDAELIAIIRAAVPSETPAQDTVADVLQRSTALIAEHPDALDYLAQLLISGAPTGEAIFDALLDLGRAQWTQLNDQGKVRTDLNPTWGPLTFIANVLGVLILRNHIDRQLDSPLTSSTQLRVWETALSSLVKTNAAEC
jgi:AcrR family transcriptional regulator